MHTTASPPTNCWQRARSSRLNSTWKCGASLWNHGYQIRKLNQAYFAFYGAYNDIGGGAGGQAGSDPVGPAVAALRAKSATLGDFLNRVAWITSLSQLEQAAK